MINSDEQLGAPGVLYRDTRANIEALTVGAGAIAYATDTCDLGTFDGSSWNWEDNENSLYFSGEAHPEYSGYYLATEGLDRGASQSVSKALSSGTGEWVLKEFATRLFPYAASVAEQYYTFNLYMYHDDSSEDDTYEVNVNIYKKNSSTETLVWESDWYPVAYGAVPQLIQMKDWVSQSMYYLDLGSALVFKVRVRTSSATDITMYLHWGGVAYRSRIVFQEFPKTHPVIPAYAHTFLARMSADQGLLLDGWYTMNLNSEVHDTDDMYNTSTKTFTVPTGFGGYWQFNLHAVIQRNVLGSTYQHYIRLYKNGSTELARSTVLTYTTVIYEGATSVDIPVLLAAGDTVIAQVVRGYGASSTQVLKEDTWWGASYIGPAAP